MLGRWWWWAWRWRALERETGPPPTAMAQGSLGTESVWQPPACDMPSAPRPPPPPPPPPHPSPHSHAGIIITACMHRPSRRCTAALSPLPPQPRLSFLLAPCCPGTHTTCIQILNAMPLATTTPASCTSCTSCTSAACAVGDLPAVALSSSPPSPPWRPPTHAAVLVSFYNPDEPGAETLAVYRSPTEASSTRGLGTPQVIAAAAAAAAAIVAVQ